jgi:hypothetical protein
MITEKRKRPDIMWSIGWHLGRVIGHIELLARRVMPVRKGRAAP